MTAVARDVDRVSSGFLNRILRSVVEDFQRVLHGLQSVEEFFQGERLHPDQCPAVRTAPPPTQPPLNVWMQDLLSCLALSLHRSQGHGGGRHSLLQAGGEAGARGSRW